MARKLLIFDLGVGIQLASIILYEAIDGYRDMGKVLVLQDGGAPHQSFDFLFRQSLFDVARSSVGLVAIGVLSLILVIALRVWRENYAHDPHFWLRATALLLFILLSPLAAVTGNYIALWHPVSNEVIARAEFGQTALMLSGVTMIVFGAVKSVFDAPVHVPPHPEHG